MAASVVKIVHLLGDASEGPVIRAALLDNGTVLRVHLNGDRVLTVHAVSASGSDRVVLGETLAEGVEGIDFCATGEAALIRAGADWFVIRRKGRGLAGARVVFDGETPGRVVSDGTALHGVFGNGAGRRIGQLIATAAGFAVGDTVALPDEAQGEVSALGAENGALVVLLDNRSRGVQAWRRDGADWTAITLDGFGRYAFNAEVGAVAPMPGGMAVAMSQGVAVTHTLFGMDNPDDLVVLGGARGWELLCGEMRYSPEGLRVPLAGPTAVALVRTDRFKGLARSGEALFAAFESGDGMVRVLRLLPGDWPWVEIAQTTGRVMALAVSKRRAAPTLLVADRFLMVPPTGLRKHVFRSELD